MRRMIAAGNWKMNGLTASLDEVRAILADCPAPECDVVICPPATLLSPMAALTKGGPVSVGGQDLHPNQSGAHTGDISSAMLVDAGATYVIIGHSERRTDHNEDDAIVHSKTTAAWGAGLVAIVCVGESLEEREAGNANDVVAKQLVESLPDGANGANTVVAYEPIWAIGTGRTASTDDIAKMHGMIRDRLRDRFGDEADKMRILYGGSVKAANATEIFALSDVDGGLVGGASLKAADFVPIIKAAS